MHDWISEAIANARGQYEGDAVFDAAVRLLGRAHAMRAIDLVDKAPYQMPLAPAWRWALRHLDREHRQFFADEEPEYRGSGPLPVRTIPG